MQQNIVKIQNPLEGDFIAAGDITLESLAKEFNNLEASTQEANWLKGYILSQGSELCEDPVCGIEGDNRDHRYGNWVLDKLSDTHPKACQRYRLQWEAFGQRRNESLIQRIPQSSRYILSSKKFDKVREEILDDMPLEGKITISIADDVMLPYLPNSKHQADIERQAENNQNIDFKDRKYHVISIDPPWPYEAGNKTSYDSEGRRVSNPYPEMSIEELAELEMPAADDSVLWLWTTHKFLPDAFELLDEWGFEYKATMVWDKQKMGMGHWLRMQCEFCLLAVKGSPVWTNTTERDLLSEKRREHSRKPDGFFTMVDEICTGAKLEYFSREKREGWDGFGNDMEKFDG